MYMCYFLGSSELYSKCDKQYYLDLFSIEKRRKTCYLFENSVWLEAAWEKNNMREAARWRWCFWLFIIVSVIWGETREGLSGALPLIIPPCHLSLDLFMRKLYGICNVDTVTYFMQGLSLSNFERSQIWRFSHFCEVYLLVSLLCKYMKLQFYFRQN